MRALVAEWDQAGRKIYGVPRGGMMCCLLLKHAEVVFDPAEADYILDDLVDSGATRDRYREQFPKAVFVALFERTVGSPWYVFPWELHEQGKPVDAVVRILQHIGEDVHRDGLQGTPERVVKAFSQMTEGYNHNPKEILSKRFEESSDQLIVVKDIPFNSLCEHHMLPFSGIAHVGYLPKKNVVGLSKIPRLVHCFAKRLQIQERLTNQVAETLLQELDAQFVGVVIESHHSCMSLRGVQSSGSMVTSAMLGELRDALKNEFMQICKG